MRFLCSVDETRRLMDMFVLTLISRAAEQGTVESAWQHVLMSFLSLACIGGALTAPQPGACLPRWLLEDFSVLGTRAHRVDAAVHKAARQ